MPISLTDDLAVLEGHIDITDVDTLHPWLQGQEAPIVDVAGCTGAHTAVVQVLLAYGAISVGAEEAGDWRQYLSETNEYYRNKEA